MSATIKEASHSLRLGRNKVKIHHENKRLYKFCSWRDSKTVIKDFLLGKLKESNVSLKEISGLDLNMKAVNPMRRSMYGGFYLEVQGEILDSGGEVIAKFSDFDFKHVALPPYITHDKDEILRKKEIEEKFGKDQYSKQHCILTQAVDDIVEEQGGKVTLNLDDKKGIDDFIVRCLELTGWSDVEDNRIHSRILRLPPHFEVPE